MRLIGNVVVAGVLLLVLGFATYGFLASFEPGPGHHIWKIGYATIGLGTLAVMGTWIGMGLKRRRRGARP